MEGVLGNDGSCSNYLPGRHDKQFYAVEIGQKFKLKGKAKMGACLEVYHN